MSKEFLNSATKAICVAVKEACDQEGIEAFLIGAQARDYWLFPKVSFRATKDVDWVIGTKDMEAYQKVRQHLIQKSGFSESSSNHFKLISPEGLELDLLPMVNEDIAKKILHGNPAAIDDVLKTLTQKEKMAKKMVESRDIDEAVGEEDVLILLQSLENGVKDKA